VFGHLLLAQLAESADKGAIIQNRF
jgi:hypothetical protein